ncbi:MAG TPA: 1-(5-phosphoribosyl)-5-[(5-phosphoribosylamino)methylideneamino]imidazole-4-carboxamide isomerase [Dehalococcoidia bacterium]|jgi:phosphoribosylformimino-5-aminoimidazole carboxamide ribotide isomerase|nr:1-(5-phosphoribosyl)-5-[(5-phosphoribosylamino)methylideneamino]imidazole-4-carboxamide isomerase [Dehalococcoidia bacterium]
MEVIPAIDIIQGRCVRLYQGDYSREMVYSADPVDVARRFQEMGAPRLHIVDLEGARAGEPRNLETVARIIQAIGIPVELGGGIRRIGTLLQVLSLGVGRVVLGTAAVESPGLVEEACSRFGEAVVIGVDARDGLVAVRGWTERSTITAAELVAKIAALGARRFIYTDIARDGTLTEPDFPAIEMLIKMTKLPIIASGGITKIEHLHRLAQLGAEGAIVGRALYTGDLDLGQALMAMKERQK